MKKFHTRAQAHITDEEAQCFLRKFVAKGMILREQRPDYYLDYEAELTENEGPSELSGKRFRIQLKGAGSLRYSKRKNGVSEYVYKKISEKHLYYFAHKERQPVFLIIVDVSKNMGYYLFIQAHLDSMKEHGGLREDGVDEILIAIPTSNLLDNLKRFIDEVHLAMKYMVKKYPGNINDAVEARKRELIKIDPRFDYNVSFNAGRESIEVVPNVTGGVKFLTTFNLSDNGLLDDFKNFGIPFETKENVEIVGLPVVEGMKVSSVKVNLSKENFCDCRIFNLKTGEHIVDIKMRATMGLKGMALAGSLGHAILNFVIKIARVNDKGIPTVQMGFDSVEWEGKLVRRLPYFDKARALVDALQKTGVSLRIEKDGYEVSRTSQASNCSDPFLVQLSNFFLYWSRAAYVSEVKGAMIHFNNKYPSSLSDVILAEIAFEYAKNNYYKGRVPISFTVQIDISDKNNRADALKAYEDFKLQKNCALLVDAPLVAFGVSIPCGRMHIAFTGINIDLKNIKEARMGLVDSLHVAGDPTDETVVEIKPAEV